MANEPVTKATVRKATGAKGTAPAAPRPGKELEPVNSGPSQRPPAGRAAAKSVERREHVTLALPLVGRVQLHDVRGIGRGSHGDAVTGVADLQRGPLPQLFQRPVGK